MKKNTVVCDPVTGMCEIAPRSEEKQQVKPLIKASGEKPIRIVYYTDPICSACWAIEGILYRLQLEYGHLFSLDMHMGGLMPSFEDADGKQALEMARMWDQAGQKYEVPVNGSVWLKNPLQSSFPPSIACKAAELQGVELSDALLRRLREMLFVEGKDISDDKVIEEAVKQLGLDEERWKSDYTFKGQALFDKDIELGISLGVWGFPTLYFFDAEGNQEDLFGVYPYAKYEQLILDRMPKAKKKSYDSTPIALMEKFKSLTVKELMILADSSYEEALQALNELGEQETIEVLESPNGNVWRMKQQIK